MCEMMFEWRKKLKIFFLQVAKGEKKNDLTAFLESKPTNKQINSWVIFQKIFFFS